MIKQLNDWIAEKYAHLGEIEFVRGRGYFWFHAEDWRLEIDNIGVCYLKHATLEQWKKWIALEIDAAAEEAGLTN